MGGSNADILNEFEVIVMTPSISAKFARRFVCLCKLGNACPATLSISDSGFGQSLLQSQHNATLSLNYSEEAVNLPSYMIYGELTLGNGSGGDCILETSWRCRDVAHPNVEPFSKLSSELWNSWMVPDSIFVSLEIPFYLISTSHLLTEDQDLLKECGCEGPEDRQTIERILQRSCEIGGKVLPGF